MKKMLFAGVIILLGALGSVTAFAQTPSFEVTPTAPPTLTNFHVTPNAIQNTTITITVAADDISGVATVQAYIMNGTTEVAVVTLLDDGSHSDSNAGDKIFGNQWNVGANAEGAYTIEVEANDLLGNSVRTNQGSFSIGGRGVTIISPANGATVYGTSTTVQVTAGGNTDVVQIQLYDGTTQVASQDFPGTSTPVTANLAWNLSSTQGSRSIHAEATVDGSTTVVGDTITVQVNPCTDFPPNGNDDPTACTNLCQNGLGYTCMAGGHNAGQLCGDPDYIYRGFDCRASYGCCSESGLSNQNANTPEVLTVPSFITPQNGTTITVPDYTVSVQITSSDPSYLSMEFYLDAGLIGTQMSYSSSPNTNIYVYSLPFDLRGVSTGSHTFAVRFYDRRDPTDFREASVTATISVTAPAVTIISPTQDEKVNGTVGVLIEASYDGGNIELLELYDDKAGFIADLKPTNPQPSVTEIIDWDTKLYSDGDYNLYVIAYSGSNYGMSTPPVHVVVANGSVTSNTNKPANTNKPTNSAINSAANVNTKSVTNGGATPST